MPDPFVTAINRLAERVRRLEIRPWGGSSGIGPGAAGHIIQDEGVDLNQRARLNFVGDGVTATDNAGTGATDVTIPGGGAGLENKVLWFDAGNDTITLYDHDAAGLDAAIASAGAGDMIVIPVDTIPGNHEIPANVAVVGWNRYTCILSGQISLNDGSKLANLSVVRSVDLVDDIYAVVGPTGENEVAYIFDCIVLATNINTGDATGVLVSAVGKVVNDHCVIDGISSGGDGYGVWVKPTIAVAQTEFSYDGNMSVSATHGTVARSDVPITPPNGGSCAAAATSCVITGVQGAGPSWVIYDLGKLWWLTRLEVRWAKQGRVEIWNTGVNPPDSNPRNWDGLIWWDNAPWPDFACATEPFTVPSPTTPGTQWARYLAFTTELLTLVGDHTWLAWFELFGNIYTYGDVDLFYNQIHGSTLDVKTDQVDLHCRAYANHWNTTEGLIEQLFGDRSAWDVEHYGVRHASDWDTGDSHHPIVTLDDNAEDIATIPDDTQVLGLDNQAANTVLAGPANGAPAAPTFRQLDLSELTGTEDIWANPMTTVGDIIIENAQNGSLGYGANQATVALGASATASSDQGGNVAGNAIDINNATYWHSANPTINQWITVDLGTEKVISEWHTLQSGDFENAPITTEVYGSHDNTNWDLLDTAHYDDFNPSASITRAFTTPVKYRYFRFEAHDVYYGRYGWILYTVDLYAAIPIPDRLGIGAEHTFPTQDPEAGILEYRALVADDIPDIPADKIDGLSDAVLLIVGSITGPNNSDLIHNISGSLSVGTNIASFVATKDMTINKVYLYGLDTGSASSTIVDIHLNGVTIFTTQANRPELAFDDADHVCVSGTPDVVDLVENDVLSVDVDQAATASEGLTIVISISFSPTPVQQTLFTVDDNVQVGLDPVRFYNATGVTRAIRKVFISANTAPTGADLIVDIHKNGVTIFTTQDNRPRITAGSYTGQSALIDVTSFGDGEYLQMAVDQIGSIVGGANLSVNVVWS